MLAGGRSGAVASPGMVELAQVAERSGGRLSPQTAADLGEALRTVVHGVMTGLQARMEIPAQLRMPAVLAFEEACTDIRSHQNAILHGMRAAYASMLEAFDPQRLEAQWGGAQMQGVPQGKDHFRDQYIEYFRKLSGDPDGSFQRLFGTVFAKAYQEQLEGLKTLEGPQRAE
jgi:predicted component of type VI protein secretion system